MDKHYEPWDLAYGNCLGTWDNEADALAGAPQAMEYFGREATEHFALAYENERGEFTKIEGEELLGYMKATV